jgi:hypothetical protein
MLLCVEALQTPEDQTLWSDLLDALDAVSPLVDDVRPGLAFLEMHGDAGAPKTWLAKTRGIVRPFGMACRLGVGANKIAARGAAYVADGTICPLGNERAFVAPLSLALLEIDGDAIERLRLLGIERLGDLARLPHGPFVRRFGPQAARWHALACGIDPTPFLPRGHDVAIEASLFGEGRTEEEAQVLFALRMLLARVCTDLCAIGKRAGALRLDIELEDAQTRVMDVPLALPTAQERAMFDVIRAKLEGITFDAPIVGLRVRAMRLENGGEAVALFAQDDLDPQKVAVTLARLEAALGAPAFRAELRPSHILENRFVYTPFELPRAGRLVPRAVTAACECAAEPWSEGAAQRPSAAQQLVPQLRLLQVAEIAVSVKRGEPRTVNGKSIRTYAGPWRVDDRNGVARDEYDVWLDDGALYRIYRQGTHWYQRGAYD